MGRSIESFKIRNTIVAVFIGLLITILSFLLAWSHVKSDAKQEFLNETHTLFEEIETKLFLGVSSLDGIITHFISTPYADESSFSIISKRFMESDPFLKATAYFHYSNASEGKTFEESMIEKGYAGFHIKHMTPNGLKAITLNDSQYYSLIYLEPLTTSYIRLLGLDIKGDKNLNKILDEIIFKNQPKGYLKPKGLDLVGKYWVFKPLFSNSTHSVKKNLSGIVGVSLNLQALIDSLQFHKGSKVSLVYENGSGEVVAKVGETSKKSIFDLTMKHHIGGIIHPLSLEVEKKLNFSDISYFPFLVALLIGAFVTVLLLYLAFIINNRTQWLLARNEEITQQITINTSNLEDAEVKLENSLERLREEEEKYRTVIQNTSEGFWLINRELITVEVNDSLYRMLEYDKGELIGKSVFDFTDAENKKTFFKQTEQIPYSKHRHYEINLEKKSGELLPVIMSATTIFSKNGEFVGAFAFVTDVSKQKKMEKELQLAASVFSHATEAIVITDVDANIIDVNNAFTEITEYSKEEAIGKNCSILKSGYHSKEFYQQMWEKLLKEYTWEGEIMNRRKNGEVYVEMLKISSIKDSNGEITQFVGLISDITLQKQKMDSLTRIAQYDPLTELPNRILLFDRLSQAMTQDQRRKQNIVVCYIDLDGFKEVNDTCGHAAGDTVLITTAQRMAKNMREGDTVARLGGDEFVALLIDLESLENAIPIIERLVSDISQPITIENKQVSVSASIGYTTYPQEENVEAETLLHQADKAMYRAKSLGKNRYCKFEL